MSINLQHKLEEQSLKITRYEKRLNDIVAAYKGLLRENKALQSTIEALNSSNSSSNKQQDEDLKTSDENDFEPEKKDQSDRISQLSSSISTLISEKSYMENKYLNEKREIKKDFTEKLDKNDNLIMKLNNKLEKANLREKEQNEIIMQFKNKSKRFQSDCCIQQDSQHLMFKEVQDLLAKERDIRANLETQLQENNQITKSSYITSIEKDLEILSFKLKNKEDSLKSQQQLHIEELNKAKRDFETSLLSEISKVDELKNEVKINLINHEKNISKLENKINELTISLSARSSIEIKHEELLRNLKEKIIHLSEENYELSLLNSTEDTESCSGELSVETTEQLKMKIIDCSNKLNEMGFEECHDVDLHFNCMKKYKCLENEFNDFKLNSEEALIKLNNKDNKDVSKLQIELNNEKSKLSILKKESEISTKAIIDKYMIDMQLKQEKIQAMHNEQLSNLRQEISEQRIRTLKIIDEKERDMKVNFENKKRIDSVTNSFNENLNTSISTGEFPIIHYSEEISRLENECTILRKEKYDLRTCIRDSERDYKLKECSLKMKIKKYEDIINTTSNSSSRANVNIDYVKNVVFALLSKPRDKKSYNNLVSALTTALHFSTEEKNLVHLNSVQKSWW